MNRKNVEPLTSHVPHFFSVSQISQLLMQNGWMDDCPQPPNHFLLPANISRILRDDRGRFIAGEMVRLTSVQM